MYDEKGLAILGPYQVAAIRILSAGVVLFPFLLKALARIPGSSWGYIVLSGLLGSFLPAFLFCVAETRISSSLTAMLNSLTPIFAVLVAAFLYRSKIPFSQVTGVIIGFLGCLLLFLGKWAEPAGNMIYGSYVLLATICYGLNVNLVRQRLSHVGALDIAAGAFAAFLLPSLLILFFTGYHQLPLKEPEFIKATAAAAVLGVVGTALASVVFYQLVKLAGSVFSSMVTYGIPLVAIGWGLLYGEKVTVMQVGALVIILGGVYIASSTFASQTLRLVRKYRAPRIKQKLQ